MKCDHARGMTLIEVVVTVAIVGVIAGVTVLALPRMSALPAVDPGRVLAATRRQVLNDATQRVIELTIDSVAHEVVVLPDGSIMTDSLVPLEQLTARWQHATH